MADANLEWHPVIELSELEDEEPEHVRIGDTLVCVVKMDGEVYAINDVCTHEFALLSEGFCDDGEVECPLHQARFNVKTGKCTAGPAEQDVARYQVRIDGDQVYVGLPTA